MSITDKLTTISENLPKIFDKGYEKGKAEAVDYMPYVSGVYFSSTLSEITDDIYLDLSNSTNLSALFSNVRLNCNKVSVKLSNKCTTLKQAFYNTSVNGGNLKIIEIIGDTSQVTSWVGCFKTCNSLEKIVGILDFSNAEYITDWFMNTYTLREITPKAGTIKISISFGGQSNLTDETIRAIIDGLADLTGLEAQTITFHATVKAKLTDEQISTITSKNWTLA